MPKDRTERENTLKRPAFLAAIEEGIGVRAAAKKAGVAIATMYQHRWRDAKFSKAWDEALERGDHARLAEMEDEADRRAMEGVERPVFHKGKQCGTIRDYSDTLLIFRMKALAPHKYRDRTEITGAHGGPITIEVVKFGQRPRPG